MTMRERKILAGVIEIQKETEGNHAFFRDNQASISPHFVMYFKAF